MLMDKRAVKKSFGITFAFIILIFGYVFFSEQSQLSSARSKTDLIAQHIIDSDILPIKQELAEYVGEVDPNTDREYFKALTSIEYADQIVENKLDMQFVEGQMGAGENSGLYSAAYAIPAVDDSSDFFVVTIKQTDDKWQLVNTKITALNPFE